ncbi:hypothetical protein SAMN02745126_02144 [Enhydrobacter aerosaccus]|uniref:Uncharacterized protein n=1 Tax=Enhydrobacter aerosaccus TaxID=225324 RepID=A0A1T4N7J5_9HYPH|nr:hypothetical protein [Enhydrobacter aerosaccus]SJZ75076.1 hypothetical protein SAMN02745126_02144 [Enhydrobacter aerosaccus]
MGRLLRENPEKTIRGLLIEFERDRREPDRWESYCLICALGYMVGGDDEAAVQQVALARLPHELRPPARFKLIPATHRALSTSDFCIALDELTQDDAPRRRRARRTSPRH